MKHFVAHRIPGLTVPVHVESAEGYTYLNSPSWGNDRGCQAEQLTFDAQVLWPVRVEMYKSADQTGALDNAQPGCSTEFDGVAGIVASFSPVG